MSKDITGKSDTENFTARRVVYYILGVLEALLAFRFVFKLLGANPNSGFVSSIYSITEMFLAPFNAIFSSPTTEGIETKAVFELNTIIAMTVYALVAWGIVKLFVIFIEGRNKNKM